jgi:hypothetical protein
LRLRTRPCDSKEANRPLAQWTDSEESFYPYNMKTLGCSRVLAPTQLLILASSVDFQTEDEHLVGKGQKPEAFSFLGLKGDFDIYIRKDSKLPVQVSGKIPKAGRINLQLREVELR